ncbi:MAG: alpha/beta hydrolase fold domain-containing protein [Atopobiaceae bacterium]|jgi:acetyl esterase/lipase
MASTNDTPFKRALKIAGIATCVPLGAFAGFTAVSHGVFRRSNMASASEIYHWLKGTRRRMVEPITWDNYILESSSANEARYSMPNALDFHYKLLGFRVPVSETTVQDMQVFTLNKRDLNDRAVIYLHGGSLLSQPDSNLWHFLDTVAQKSRAEIIVPLYPLAPNHHWQETFSLLENLYAQTVVEFGAQNVTLMGDEAGGGIAAAFAEQLVEDGTEQPAHLILISPWVDATLNNPRIPAFQQHDPMLSVFGLRRVAKIWADGTDLYDYHLSPINGRVRGLKNLMVFAGTREILYPDAKLFCERVQATGAHAEFIEGRGLNNNFPLYPLPEANKAIQTIVNAISMD